MACNNYIGIDGSGKGYTDAILSDGSVKRFTGPRGTRSNNPGNLVGTSSNFPFYRDRFGAVGIDYAGGLVFGSMQGGLAAQKDLVTRKFGNRTIWGMIYGDGSSTANSYAPYNASNDPKGTNKKYADNLASFGGWNVESGNVVDGVLVPIAGKEGPVINTLTPAQTNQLIADMIRVENGSDYLSKVLECADLDGIEEGNYPKSEEEGEDTVSSKDGDSRNDNLSPPVGEYGYKDPAPEFVVPDYRDEQETNKAARGGWDYKLDLGSKGNRGVELLPREASPQYPHNKVTESSAADPEKRHRIEIDDTPDAPRVTIAHEVGSGLEMWQDGKLVVSSYGDMVEVVGGDFHMVVNGDGHVTYVGNLNLTVEGDMNLHVKGDMTTTVEGEKKEVYRKNHITEVGRNRERTVKENKTEVVLKQETKAVLGGGLNYGFYKGETRNIYQDVLELSAGKDLELSGQENIFLSATTKIDMNAGDRFVGRAVNVDLEGAATLDLRGPASTWHAQTIDTFASTNYEIATPLVQWHLGAGNIGGPAMMYYGISLEGDFFVDGNLTVDGNITHDGNLLTGGGAYVDGAVHAGTEMISGGDITAFGSATASGAPAIVAGTEGAVDAAFVPSAPSSGSIASYLAALATSLPAVATDLTVALSQVRSGVKAVSVDPGNKVAENLNPADREWIGYNDN